jgi:MerR family transcriptional regulator/heat shock protein HspR
MNEERSLTTDHEEPAYIISVAARMLGLHAQTLRYYERVGLIVPSRSRGRIRLYSRADLERVRQVQRLIDELGVNLAGAEVIIDMSARLRALEEENEGLRRELQKYRDARLPAPLREG